MTPERQRNLTQPKWLLKHDCCPWIPMAICQNVQTRESEISKLITPLRISLGHNMSSACQQLTFMYPSLISEFVELCCVSYYVEKGKILHAKKTLVTLWITWDSAAYSLWHFKYWRAWFETSTPLHVREVLSHVIFISMLGSTSSTVWWTAGAKCCKRRVNPCHFGVKLHNHLALTGLLRCINLSLSLWHIHNRGQLSWSQPWSTSFINHNLMRQLWSPLWSIYISISAHARL